MSFQKSAQSLKCKLHLSEVSQPVLVGVGAVVLAVVLISGFSLVRLFASDSMTFSLNDGSYAAVGAGFDSLSNDGIDAANHVETQSPKMIFVHISGEVVSPGVVELPEGSRAFDAIEAAGGFTDSALPESLNLAREVQDGEQLYVLSLEGSAGEMQPSVQGFASAEEGSSPLPNGLINVNTANQDALESLPGIGSRTAEKIIKERETNGLFASVEDLKRVSGIGDKKLESLREHICVQ